MKKIFAMMLVVLLVVTCLAGCNKLEAGKVEDPSSTEKADEVNTTAPEKVTDEEVETEEPSNDTTEETTANTQEVTGDTTEGGNSNVVLPDDFSLEDISAARKDTTPENPAEMGEWVLGSHYSVKSDDNEPVYWRVIGVTFDCQDDIDAYNAEDHLVEFAPLEDETFSYCEVIYQVYYPTDFPVGENGILTPDISLSAVNPEGGGINYKGVSYIGLGSTKGITTVEEGIQPGECFTGKAIYMMIDDPSIEYVFRLSYYDESGEFTYCYSKAK